MRDLAEAVRSEVERSARRFAGWSEAEATRARGPGRWMRKEILGHLIDSAFSNHERFVRAQLGAGYAGPGYEQQLWVALHGYRERPWRELVELWVAANRHVAAVVERVPESKLGTPCTIGDDPPATLEFLMRDYLSHMKKHLAQIEAS
jgi:hypothetical protein